MLRDHVDKLRSLVSRNSRLENVPLWSAALLTGVASVLFAHGFNVAEEFSQTVQASPWFFLLAPVCFFASWLLVEWFAPFAKGSGIPQVMAAIQIVESRNGGASVGREVSSRRLLAAGWLSGLLGWRTVIVKILSALVCVFGGGAIGREGPTIQIAAGLFFAVSLAVRPVFASIDTEAWLIAGGGAGIAAAFNTPLGGLVYAIEELATRHFNQFRTALISSVMVSGLAALWLAGNYLYFGAGKPTASTSLAEFVCAILVGAICGACGHLFGMALVKISSWRMQLGSRGGKALLACACGLAIAGLAWAAGPKIIGPGRSVVLSLLGGETEPSLTLAAGRFVTPIVSYAAGGAGGIFAPSLAAGASLGSFAGKIYAQLGAFLGPSLGPSLAAPGTDFFILIGMVAFLTGVTHAPFTSLVLIMEMSDRHSQILVLMLATFAAFAAARMLGRHSFYEIARNAILADFRGGTETPAVRVAGD